MREYKPIKPATLDSIADQLLKLCRSVESLDGQVGRLSSKIREFEPPSDSRYHRLGSQVTNEISLPHSFPKNETTLERMLRILDLANTRLRGAEIDIGNVRSQLDQISNDSWSRADLKDHIQKPKGRR